MTFGTELQQSSTCFEEPNTGLAKSPTYKQVGTAWSTNEWTVEQENRVGYITALMPSAFVYANPIKEKASVMLPWTKPISSWKLECEFDPSNPITRQDAYSKLYS